VRNVLKKLILYFVLISTIIIDTPTVFAADTIKTLIIHFSVSDKNKIEDDNISQLGQIRFLIGENSTDKIFSVNTKGDLLQQQGLTTQIADKFYASVNLYACIEKINSNSSSIYKIKENSLAYCNSNNWTNIGYIEKDLNGMYVFSWIYNSGSIWKDVGNNTYEYKDNFDLKAYLELKYTSPPTVLLQTSTDVQSKVIDNLAAGNTTTKKEITDKLASSCGTSTGGGVGSGSGGQTRKCSLYDVIINPPTFTNLSVSNSAGTCTYSSGGNDATGVGFLCKIDKYNTANNIQITYHDKYLNNKTQTISNVTPDKTTQKIYGSVGVTDQIEGADQNKEAQIKISVFDQRTITNPINYTIKADYSFTCSSKDLSFSDNIKTATPVKPTNKDTAVHVFASGSLKKYLYEKNKTNCTDQKSITAIKSIKYSVTTDQQNTEKPKSNEKSATTEQLTKLWNGTALEDKIIISADGTVNHELSNTESTTNPTIDNTNTESNTAGSLEASFWTTGGVKPVTAQAPFFGTSKTYTSMADYLNDFYYYAIWLIVAIVIVMIIYGGYLIITSSGNPEGVNKGRGIIVSALTALLVLILAYVILRIISPQIVENQWTDLPQNGMTVDNSSSSDSSSSNASNTPTKSTNTKDPNDTILDDISQDLHTPSLDDVTS